MKACRSIRRGVKATTDAITVNALGNDFKGSPLEVVLTALTEPKPVFCCACLPFDALEKHAEAMATFGERREIPGKIARRAQGARA